MFLIRAYGTDQYFKKHPSIATIENYDEFFGLANEGMKKAQLILLDKIRLNIQEQENLKGDIKKLRQTNPKDKEPIKALQQQLKIAEWHENIYRSLVHMMVWQMFGGHREIIAQHYLEEKGTKSLNDEGFKATVKVAETINKDPLKFALIADLATNMQVGDLVVWTKNGIELNEVKTGEMNKKALDLFKFYAINEIDPDERIALMDESHFKDQLKRMLKQKETLRKTAKIVNTGFGVYQKDENTTMHLQDSVFVEEKFDDEIIGLYQSIKDEKWAYTNVEGIVNIGVCREEWRGTIGETVLKTTNNGFPVYDLRQGLGVHAGEGLFSKPYPEDMIMDILFGKVQIFVGIDYDKLIEYANDIGLPLRWSTKRELQDIRERSPLAVNEIFGFNNKGLVIADGETQAFLGMGFMSRLLFDNKTPQIQLKNRLETWKEMMEKYSNKNTKQ